MKLELFAYFLTIHSGTALNPIYNVEDNIEFYSLSTGSNYVSLLNSIDSDTEHSKALYSNMTQILDSSLLELYSNSNSWTIPYDVNYIPSLGTDFNLIFTENQITAVHFKESDITGNYQISNSFEIISDKNIDLDYNNNTLFQPGEEVSIKLEGFRNIVWVELLSKDPDDSNWIMYPSLQRYVNTKIISGINSTTSYIYQVPVDIQKYFNIDFKLRFTEIYNGAKTIYTIDSFKFNIPGISIINSNSNKNVLNFTIEWNHFPGLLIIELRERDNNGLIDSFNYRIVDNFITIENIYTSGNYTINFIDQDNTHVKDTVEIEILKAHANIDGEDNGNNIIGDEFISDKNNEDIYPGVIIAISLSVFFLILIIIVIAVKYKPSNIQVHPNRSITTTTTTTSSTSKRSLNNPTYETNTNGPIYSNKITSPNIYNNKSNYNNLDRNKDNYNNLDRNRTIVNDVYRNKDNYSHIEKNRTIVNDVHKIAQNFKIHYKR
jgi:hypothetical protein